MRSTGDPDRRGLWRALLNRALARGDMLGASRAWDHLRVAGAALTRDEAHAARAARIAVGHAIRDARWRHDHDVLYGLPVGAAALPAFPRQHVLLSPWLLAPVAAGALMIALIFLWRPVGQGLSAPALAPAAPAIPTAAIAFGGRGRTEATPRPTALPTAVATAAPQPTFYTGPVGTGAAADREHVGEAGTVFPPLPNDWDRFIFKVVDAQGTPLANVCVIYGTPDCGPSRPRTNASGLWWIDFPRSEALSRTWDFGFALTGFDTQRVSLAYVPGATNVKEIRMVKAR